MEKTARVLVTGGSGFLGRHLAEARGAQRWSWVAPSSSLLDLRDRAVTLPTAAVPASGGRRRAGDPGR